jgi:hypothetical protein
MDATTHFQMASREVKNIYEAVTGKTEDNLLSNLNYHFSVLFVLGESLDLNSMPSEEDMGEN